MPQTVAQKRRGKKELVSSASIFEKNLLPQPHIEGFIWSDAFPARTTSMVFLT
jgi:hypothetical protein